MQALSRDSCEARLFWHLLDETQGEDWATFYSYALSVLEVIHSKVLLVVLIITATTHMHSVYWR
jgi:hypothetical protein